MTNKEKYPNEDAIKREAKKFFYKSLFSSLLFGAIYKDLTNGTLPKTNKDETSINGVECPICHDKDVHIKYGLEPGLICDSCGIVLMKSGINPGLPTSDFKEFLSDLCKKNKKA